MNKPVCKCGMDLEEGFMGCLWCPNCGINWKMPDGVTPETHPEYYFHISAMPAERKGDDE